VFTIREVRLTATADKTDTVTLKLPKPAVAALEAGARETMLFTLIARNVSGVHTVTTKFARLKLIEP
jgi:hypothetical protein